MQGFNRVSAASMLISGQAVLEIAGTLAVFLGGLSAHEVYLHNMGLVTLSSAFIAACVGTSPVSQPMPAVSAFVHAADKICCFFKMQLGCYYSISACT